MAGEQCSNLERLVRGALGQAGPAAIDRLVIEPRLLAETGETVSRAVFAMALNAVLFDDLMQRVPSGAAYVAKTLASGVRVTFDHGALRTIRLESAETGVPEATALPSGIDAFTRIFAPLGYRMAAVYPLPALKMTGYAWCHADAPQAIPQFFLSELHVDRFDEDFAEAARRVFAASRDPLDEATKATLDSFAASGEAPLGAAAAALPVIVSAFGRQHAPARIEDYQCLLEYSKEAAWICTEGNAFNHATNRVADVAALAEQLKGSGYAVKDQVEISASGRVKQTALRADPVEREFADGVMRPVPGSFFEFISRDRDPATGALDLRFDSGNATGIFAMTRTA